MPGDQDDADPTPYSLPAVFGNAVVTSLLSLSPTATDDSLTLRALVNSKDAGVVIGKTGATVARLLEQTGVKAGVSKVIPGVHERVLSSPLLADSSLDVSRRSLWA
ncbi:hypothetical protein DICSQDRAFT_175830 [Dichomitus squalens LYAD-421 SS1]|uniref:K Homology domain-containing protein n=1 Tax=Dichomitus squalens (strain LYAD-421) TaxID=732165 RepID=R7SH60_DICSQ|nr:uncharacterized protein DICSQDRAFT_175830 [Dichomitus squalens LYAD-421 SS1]EJF55499.1 hypothetical protein DICSQDRAFT_175830 [Dichomitus squalens LYAD-421 SS1]